MPNEKQGDSLAKQRMNERFRTQHQPEQSAQPTIEPAKLTEEESRELINNASL